jgi:hypothetical protein
MPTNVEGDSVTSLSLSCECELGGREAILRGRRLWRLFGLLERGRVGSCSVTASGAPRHDRSPRDRWLSRCAAGELAD